MVQLPGLAEDINRAIDIIKRTARLEFKLVDEKGDLAPLKREIFLQAMKSFTRSAEILRQAQSRALRCF